MKSKRCPIIVRVRFEGKKERCVHSPKEKKKGRDVFFFLKFFRLKGRKKRKGRTEGTRKGKERKGKERKETNT